MHHPSSPKLRRGLVLAAPALASLLLAAVQQASAATQYWDPGFNPTLNSGKGSGGNGTWATATANWSNGATDAALTATNISGFGGASGTVTLTTAVTTAGLQFDTSGYTVGAGATTAQISITPQTADTSGIVVGTGVTGTVIDVGSIKLGSSGSAVNILLTNTDLVDFKNTTIFLTGSRTTKITNSTASGTTTIAKFGVTDKAAGGTWPNAGVQLSQGNLTINALAGAGNPNGTLATFGGNATGTSFPTVFSGATTGTLTINGNNTLYNNSGTAQLAQLTFAFNMPTGTLALGHDNALGARNASNALTGTILQVTAGTVAASGGARNIENPVLATGSFTIGGANNLTLAGSVTNSGGNRTLTVTNTGSTTLSGNVFLSESSTTARTLTIGGTTNATISGPIANFNGSGLAGGLTKIGTNTLTLSNSGNTYSGATTLSGGVLALGANNALSPNSAISVDAATLDTGTFSAAATSLALTSAAASLKFDFTGRSINNVAAFLALGGSFTELTDLSGYTLDFSGFTFSSAGSYKLLSFSSISGTLVDSDFITTNLNLSGVTGTLSLTGNDLSFVVTSAVPEPSSYAALAGLVGLGYVALRRRRA